MDGRIGTVSPSQEGYDQMNDEPTSQEVELRITYRYAKEHPWVVQAVTGFLSAYFMAKPGFRIQRHFDELESGMHVWICDVPSNMKVLFLLKRLQEDIPPCRYSQAATEAPTRPQYLIDSIEKADG
jgi:hypothetical protein